MDSMTRQRVDASLDAFERANWYWPRSRDYSLRRTRAFFLRVADMLPTPCRLLDLGCGATMPWRPVFEAMGATWSGVDVFDVEADGYVRGTPDKVPVETASRDAVAMVDVLEHFEAPEQMMAEVSRVVAPGGLVFGSVAFWQFEHDSYVHFTHRGLAAILGRHGLEVEYLAPTAITGVQQWAQRVFGGNGKLNRWSRRALADSVVRGTAALPVFVAANVLERVRTAVIGSEAAALSHPSAFQYIARKR